MNIIKKEEGFVNSKIPFFDNLHKSLQIEKNDRFASCVGRFCVSRLFFVIGCKGIAFPKIGQDEILAVGQSEHFLAQGRDVFADRRRV